MALTTADRDRVLAWMTSTGKGPAAAVSRFAPDLVGDSRRKACDRVRSWARRARAEAAAADAAAAEAAAKARRAPPRQQAPAAPQRTPAATDGGQLEPRDLPDPLIAPMDDLASMGPIKRLEWLLARALALCQAAYTFTDLKGAGSVFKVAKDLGDAVDVAREREGKLEELGRTADGAAVKINALEADLRRLLQQSQHAAATRKPDRDL